jgi:hypothetical protein
MTDRELLEKRAIDLTPEEYTRQLALVRSIYPTLQKMLGGTKKQNDEKILAMSHEEIHDTVFGEEHNKKGRSKI